MSEFIKAYKGFDKSLQCRGFQFEVGKEFEESAADVCKRGFHACEMPLDVLSYYEPGKGSRYCVVEQSGEIGRDDDGTKVASSKIKIGAEIGIPGLVKAQIEYVQEKATPSGKHHTTGDWSANSATGYGSANVSTGTGCKNDAAGERNIGVAWGPNSFCKGSVGSFLVLSEWGAWDGKKYPFIGASMIIVDGENIKPDTWYALKNGHVVEVSDPDKEV